MENNKVITNRELALYAGTREDIGQGNIENPNKCVTFEELTSYWTNIINGVSGQQDPGNKYARIVITKNNKSKSGSITMYSGDWQPGGVIEIIGEDVRDEYVGEMDEEIIDAIIDAGYHRWQYYEDVSINRVINGLFFSSSEFTFTAIGFGYYAGMYKFLDGKGTSDSPISIPGEGPYVTIYLAID